MEQVGFVKKVNKNKVEVEVRRISGCGGGFVKLVVAVIPLVMLS